MRERPAQAAVSASGSSRVHSETFVVPPTPDRIEVRDVTDSVSAIVGRSGVHEGTVTVCTQHTTCGVFINEFQVALIADIKTFLERIVARGAGWKHDDPAHSDCDRANADSHLRAILLGPSLTLPVSGGEVVLGQWQRVLLGELDGPRERSVRVVVMGVA
jgi:secondary thiamine-phosphate synthase enzyme